MLTDGAEREGRARDGLVLWLAAGVAATVGARLALQAAHGIFAWDEGFHALVSEWIATHRAIPTELPQFYGGFSYYYPPLLHLLGAVAFAFFGNAGLHLLPVALWAATVALLLCGAPRTIPTDARAWAAALAVASLMLAATGVLLYVEVLTALLFTAAAVSWASWRATPRPATALALGGVLGLALLAKFTAWIPVVLVAAAAGGFALRGDRTRARQLAAATGVAIAIALPWLLRNQILFGSAFYPAWAPDLDRAYWTLDLAHHSMPAAALCARAGTTAGAALLGAALLATGLGVVQRSWRPGHDLVAFAIAGIVVSSLAPMAAPRHWTPFLPVLALGSAWVVRDALPASGGPARVLGALLLGAALLVGLTRDDPRRIQEQGPALADAYRAVTAHVPAAGRVLSLWTYDTAYHGGRAATWPLAWGQRQRPLAEFSERDPGRLAALFARDSIDWVLVPIGTRPRPFDSTNYPASLLAGLEELMRRGAAQPVWASSRFALIHVGASR